MNTTDQIKRYKFLNSIGEGSQGYVIEAVDTETKRLVAIKLVKMF